MNNGTFYPVGNCFAISPRHLITAQHNLEGNRTTNYAFTRVVTREQDSHEENDMNTESTSEIQTPDGVQMARVIHYNKQLDYAILENISTGQPELQPIPISFMPVEEEIDMKVYHSPVTHFNNHYLDNLPIFSDWKISNESGDRHMLLMGGLSKGSSGGALVTRDGYAIGMHVESNNEIKTKNAPKNNQSIKQSKEDYKENMLLSDISSKQNTSQIRGTYVAATVGIEENIRLQTGGVSISMDFEDDFIDKQSDNKSFAFDMESLTDDSDNHTSYRYSKALIFERCPELKSDLLMLGIIQ